MRAGFIVLRFINLKIYPDFKNDEKNTLVNVFGRFDVSFDELKVLF